MEDAQEEPRFTLEETEALIERMKSTMTQCWETCSRVRYLGATAAYCYSKGWDMGPWAQDTVTKWMAAEGFGLTSDFPGYLKRCDKCATTPHFPWADKLDPAKVLTFVLSDERCETTFELDILAETLPIAERPAPRQDPLRA